MEDQRFCDDEASDESLQPTPAYDDLAEADAVLSTDFARYLMSLPEPTDNGVEPDLTSWDLEEQSRTTAGADKLAARAACLDPGESSAQILAVLKPSSLSAGGMLDAACAAERLASWVHATQLRHLAAFASPGVAAHSDDLNNYASAPGQPLHSPKPAHRRPGPDLDDDLTSSGSQVYGDRQRNVALIAAAQKVAAAEVSAALLISPLNAGRRVAHATTYVEELPATLNALSIGIIDRGRAMVIADRTQNLPTDLRHRVEEAVVAKAVTRTAGQLRAIADRAVIAIDPEAAKKRHEVAKRNRGVSLRPDEDGMSQVRADLTADKACTAFNLIDQIAMFNARDTNEKRPIGALRADAFADIFDQLADNGAVDLQHLLSSRDNTASDRPGEPEYTNATGADANQEPRGVDGANEAGQHETLSNTDDFVAGDALNTEPEGPELDPDDTVEESEPGTADDRETGVQKDPETDVADDPETDVADDDETGVRNDPETDVADDSATGVADHPETRPADDPETTSTGTSTQVSSDKSQNGGSGIARADRITNNSGRPGTRTTTHTDRGTSSTSRFVGEPATEFAAAAHADSDSELNATLAGQDESLGPVKFARNPASGSMNFSDQHHAPSTHDAPAEINLMCPGTRKCACGQSLPSNREPARGLGTHQGRPTNLNITMAATTLAGLDDLPAELDGHGPIHPDIARALLDSAATITAVAVNPACGTALDLGRTVYRPRLAQRDYVTKRDQTCRFPSCRQPAWRCQIDHSNEFCPGTMDSGVTCPCNLTCLCKFHHDLKTFRLWDTEHHSDGSITWTSPIGRAYTTQTRQWLTGMTDEPSADREESAVLGSTSADRRDSADLMSPPDSEVPPF